MNAAHVLLTTPGHPPQPASGDGWQMLAAWSLDPSVLLGCAVLLAVYVWVVLRTPHWTLRTRRTLSFALGVLLLLLALVSPLDTLGDMYLFSAHMAQHLILLLAVPPLLIWGVPGSLWERIFSVPALAALERVLRLPLLAWMLGVGAMWVWHVPALYDAALRDENVHIVQHLTFLVTATVFWWPVLGPGQYRYEPIVAVAYLLTAGVAGTVLGIGLTFAPTVLYTPYMQPNDPLGVLPLIRNGWGISALADQQIGGLVMWVPGGLVYLCAILGVLARWFSEPDVDELVVDGRLRAVSSQVQDG